MRKPRIGAVMIVQNDSETMQRALASFYDHVERIVVSTDPARGHSGKPIQPDNCLEIVRAFDRENKVDIIEDNFYVHEHPMQNETYQREVSVKRLNDICPGLDWIVQIDADEEFINFNKVVETLGSLPNRTSGVYWRWIQLFQILDDGRYLMIVDEKGDPILEQFPLAHRPETKLQSARHVEQRIANPRLRRLLKYEFVWPLTQPASFACLHYSYAKSESRIREKLLTWSHSKDFDTSKFLELWLRSKTDWRDIRNFHPTYPQAWPALRPMSLDEVVPR